MKGAPRRGCSFSACRKKPRRDLLPQQQIKFNSFCGGAHPRVASLAPAGPFTSCTRHKIHYRTQVCSLSALSGQRASPKGISFGHARCPAGDFVEKPDLVFRQSQKEHPGGGCSFYGSWAYYFLRYSAQFSGGKIAAVYGPLIVRKGLPSGSRRACLHWPAPRRRCRRRHRGPG